MLEEALEDSSYSDTYNALHHKWMVEEIRWIVIAANIFDVRQTVNAKATAVTASLLNMDI
jgi:hypothetical protein